MSTKPANIDEYIAAFPELTQNKLREIREIISKAAPDAEEVISYSIAAFKLNGKILVYFAGFKNHVSIYPAPAASEGFEDDYAGYDTSGKGTIQFKLDKALPAKLITKIVRYRLEQLRKPGAR